MPAEFRRVIMSDSDEENSPPAIQSSTTAEASQSPEKRNRVRFDYEDATKYDAEQYEEYWSSEKGMWIRDKVAENEEEAVVSYYYCRYKKLVGSNCQRKLKVTRKDNSYEVALSKGDHEHNEESALTHEVKDLTRVLNFAMNKHTKELDLDRKKVSFRAFVEIVEKVVNRWSALPDYSEVASEPRISPDTYVQAYQLSSAREGRLQVGDDEGHFVLVPSSKNKNVTAEQLLAMDERLKHMQVESWNAFMDLRMGFYAVDPTGPWFRCSCPVGMKKSVCKHGLRLMCSKKVKSYPPDAKAVPQIRF